MAVVTEWGADWVGPNVDAATWAYRFAYDLSFAGDGTRIIPDPVGVDARRFSPNHAQ